ncbi:hypothetical protein DFR55_11913 [Herbinix hemicellulosilytica]|uniref:DUF2225 domain-containing protein n=1 Tax=Herbinix hemicellulosilytica TaxID=1564487 RepID=A0A0H5SSZ3_HERHM|nr:DUF2225 domain-containing protein [Herbinix hemicellulosilytica]RBP57745.1 hypothetical protein DFR55_11913 [Herbinix hemicellulosilytica]CRZ33423.1 hypothetical protein HHT355_0211 [Herbinix hemicellulosilytica]
MSNLFSGLEEFGLNNLSNINIYEDSEKSAGEEAKKSQQNTFSEEDIIYDRSYTCPVCNKDFKAKTVKVGKLKLQSLDTDLRPKYQLADPLKYDAILCPNCGYAALNRFFNHITGSQADLIKKNISVKYKHVEESENIYTYDTAIARHKMALINSIVKKAKLSEKAYTCLKTAWVIRGKRETLPEDTPNYKETVEKLLQEEKEFISNAYEGFSEAYMKEEFPMCGMDVNTITLLVAELARKVGKYDECSRWISKILISKEASERIKEKAREIKEMLKEGM